MKKRILLHQPRPLPVSNRWRSIVLDRIGVTSPDKDIDKIITGLWKKGYSFKYVAERVQEHIDDK